MLGDSKLWTRAPSHPPYSLIGTRACGLFRRTRGREPTGDGVSTVSGSGGLARIQKVRTATLRTRERSAEIIGGAGLPKAVRVSYGLSLWRGPYGLPPFSYGRVECVRLYMIQYMARRSAENGNTKNPKRRTLLPLRLCSTRSLSSRLGLFSGGSDSRSITIGGVVLSDGNPREITGV
eukprot:180928-Prymnesium_polylepis.1